MERQGLTITIKELNDLIEELQPQADTNSGINGDQIRFQINIINKKGLSDTWELEK